MKRAELANLLRRSPAKANFFTYLCLFLLPWQTVWIYGFVNPSPLTPLPVGEGEYWKLTHYLVQFLIVITVLIRWETKKSETAKKIMFSLWLFFVATTFTSFLSVNFYLSGAFLFHLFSALLLFWLLLDERIETRKIIWFLSLGLIVPCLIGWWQVLAGWSPASTWLGLSEHLTSTLGTAVVETSGERIMRAYGTFAHPNIFGGFLAMTILMILGRMIGSMRSDELGRIALLRRASEGQAIRPYGRLWYAAIVRTIILILLSLTLVVTFSRSAWLALLVGIISFLIVNIIKHRKITRQFLKGLVVVFVSVIICTSVFHTAVFTRVGGTERLEEKSLSERQTEYQMIGEMIKINPFVGVGPGAYTLALAEKFPDHEVWFYQPMHNSFLLFFAETGLLGLVFLIYFLWVVFVQYKRKGEWPFAPTAIVAILATLALFDHYLWSQWAGLALTAVILAIFTRNLEEKY